jgi:gliding motility-associated-like protein
MARCYLECNGQAAIIATAGVPPYQYLWNTSSTNDTLFNLCSGTYYVTVTESHGCIRTVYAEITQPDLLTISHSALISPGCNGTCTGAICITASGGTPPYSYVWSEGTGTDSINPHLCAGSYSVTITDSHGCTFDTTFVLQQPDSLTATVTTTKVPCAEVCNGTADITIAGGIPPYQIHWDNGQQTSHATSLCLGNHYVTVIDSNLCSLTLHFAIADTSYFSAPIHAWASPDTIYQSQTVQLNATVIAGFTYTWTPSASVSNAHIPNPTATPDNITDYIVHVYDTFGCEKSDTVNIYVKEVICKEPFIYVPNAFTPNIDQKNDKVFVRSDIIESVYFAIYDRWGEKVFETTDMNVGWDGTFRGRKCDPAVFVYYIEATCITKDRYINKGNITLIR